MNKWNLIARPVLISEVCLQNLSYVNQKLKEKNQDIHCEIAAMEQTLDLRVPAQEISAGLPFLNSSALWPMCALI